MTRQSHAPLVPLLIIASMMMGHPQANAVDVTQAFRQKHCVECHDADVQKGDLDLTVLKFDLTQPLNFLEWARVHDRVKAGEMPPKKKPRPEAGELEGFLGGLRSQLVEADSQRQAVEGRTELRRRPFEDPPAHQPPAGQRPGQPPSHPPPQLRHRGEELQWRDG
jgi:hypothetical protein